MLIEKPLLHEYKHGGCHITCIVTGEKWKQNSYIVTHISTSTVIVIDPGSSADLMIQLIQDAGGKVSRILVTHPHHDHVGAAARISEYFNVVSELHKLDVRLLMHAPMYALRFANHTIPAITRFRAFDELIQTEAPAVRSIHTPGHTKGSTCYYFDGFVFTGDTLLYKYIGRTDLPGSSLLDLNASVAALLAELPDNTEIFPGHGKPWIVRDAKKWWHNTQNTPLPQHDKFVHM